MSEVVTDRLIIGLDLGNRHSQCCALDYEGEVLEQSTVPTTQAGLRHWFTSKGSARVILEAETRSHWVSHLPTDHGHEVIVANPRMLRYV